MMTEQQTLTDQYSSAKAEAPDAVLLAKKVSAKAN